MLLARADKQCALRSGRPVPAQHVNCQENGGCRRLLLRTPELPDALLPAEWPGQKARLLCKALYRRLAPASERHLDRCLVLADGTIPSANPAFADRFPQDDPLAAMSL